MSSDHASPHWDVAREQAVTLGSAHPMPAVVVPISEAAGHRAATDAHALVSLPGADLSAMDGWAVAGEGPWIVGPPVPMGHGGAGELLRPGRARPITTGAVVPRGAAAVIRSEHGLEEWGPSGELVLRIKHAAADDARSRRTRHIRSAGEEISVGEVLWTAGTLLTPAHIAFGAVAGRDAVSVLRRPRGRLIVTGDEVVRAGTPRIGEVRDAYTPVFPGLLPLLGIELDSGHHAADSHSAVSEALSSPDGCDLVITTGGTSRGSGDWVRDAVRDAGGTIVVDGVRMRPGHPVLIARLGDGTPILALPGNPLAALVCLLSFAPALVAGMAGRRLPPLPQLTGLDAAAIEADTRIVPFRWEGDRPVATSWRGAAMLRGLSEADGLAVIAPQQTLGPTRLLPLPWRGSAGG